MDRKVFVVETLHTDPRVGWVVWSVHRERGAAWENMRNARSRYDKIQFRTLRYSSPNPGEKL